MKTPHPGSGGTKNVFHCGSHQRFEDLRDFSSNECTNDGYGVLCAVFILYPKPQLHRKNCKFYIRATKIDEIITPAKSLISSLHKHEPISGTPTSLCYCLLRRKWLLPLQYCIIFWNLFEIQINGSHHHHYKRQDTGGRNRNSILLWPKNSLCQCQLYCITFRPKIHFDLRQSFIS